MIKRSSNCAICENTNRASICSACVNHRLIEYNTLLKSLKTRRDSLYSRLSELLESKVKADDQKNWRLIHNEKLLKLKKNLGFNKEQVSQGKAKIDRETRDLKVKYGVLDSARSTLEENRVEQVEKYFPNLICTQSLGHMAISSECLHKQSVVVKQICKLFPLRRVTVNGGSQNGSAGQYNLICNSRLPRGLDPHSIPSEELAVSMGYKVQLLNLVVHNLAAPILHSSGFAGSCSRIWQRDSYWDARPSTRSNEYPLFIPRKNYCSTSVENSWTDKNSSNFGVASMESDRKEEHLDSTGSNSFKYSSASPHSIESHRDLQKGIALLKKSVACLTAYCYNSLCLEVPPEASTFEAFAKLLATLSSSKEVRSVFSLKMASSRSCKQAQQLNKSIWNAHSVISSSLLESAHLPDTAESNGRGIDLKLWSPVIVTGGEWMDLGNGVTVVRDRDFTGDLPDECLAHVFQFLGAGDRKRCSLVCKRWLFVDGQNRHRLSLDAKDEIFSFLTSMFNRFDSVTKLALRCDRKSVSLSDEALAMISVRCLNLTRVKLRGCREITDLGMEKFARNCKNLKKLSVGSCNFGAKGVNAMLEHCKLLEELSVK